MSVKTRPPLEHGDKRGGKYWDGEAELWRPSVTTILNEVSKPALIGWAAKTAATYAFEHPYASLDEAKAAPTAARDSAAQRGSTIHSIAEALQQGADIELDTIPTQYRGYAEGLWDWWLNTNPELLHAEIVAINERQNYAGTADAIIRTGGGVGLIDYKTSAFADTFTWSLQLSAYLHATYFLDPRERTRVEVPQVDYVGVVQLGKDGKWSWHTCADQLPTFLAYRHVWAVRNEQPCWDECWMCSA